MVAMPAWATARGAAERGAEARSPATRGSDARGAAARGEGRAVAVSVSAMSREIMAITFGDKAMAYSRGRNRKLDELPDI